MDIGILEISGIIVTLSTAIGVPVALVKWCGGYVSDRVADEAKDRALAIQHLDNSIATSNNTITANITALDQRIGQTIGHKVNNHTMRLDALERDRNETILRIVKVETAVQAIDKSLERVEHGQEKLSETINDRFDTLAESIREVRTVAPRN